MALRADRFQPSWSAHKRHLSRPVPVFFSVATRTYLLTNSYKWPSWDVSQYQSLAVPSSCFSRQSSHWAKHRRRHRTISSQMEFSRACDSYGSASLLQFLCQKKKFVENRRPFDRCRPTFHWVINMDSFRSDQISQNWTQVSSREDGRSSCISLLTGS